MSDKTLTTEDQGSTVTSLQNELNSITQDLDNYIEKNSERNLEFMKFETVDRLGNFIKEYKDMIEVAKRLEEEFLTDPKILSLQKEVEWFEERVKFFENMKNTDLELLNQYQQQYKSVKNEKISLEAELKTQKNEVNRLKKSLQTENNSSPIPKSSILQNVSSDFSSNIPSSEKSQIEYLENASKKLQKTLKTVKAEIKNFKSLQFQSRQEILPIENFFQDCYKSVYHLIFQRQSQLNDEQLSLAYKMFRENKMDLSQIRHKPAEIVSGTNSHVIREAISLQNQQRIVKARQENKKKNDMTWKEFKKLPTETIFIMISNQKMMKEIKKSMCSLNSKTFLTSESKGSVDQLEEFCIK